jgi:hypothetical protein
MRKISNGRESRPDDENPELNEASFVAGRPAIQVLPQFIGKKATQELLRRDRRRPIKNAE